MKLSHLILTFVCLVIAGMLTSCVSTHPDPYVRAGRNRGMAAGAITGAVIGNNVRGGNSWGGAAIGAAVGGLAGDRRGKTNSMYHRPSRYRYY
jgi:uncharacterized membrane protein